MLPAIVSQLVVIVKDTALGGVMLGFTELLNSRSTLAANYANVIPSFIVVAVIFIVLNFLLTTFASWLEGRLRRSKKSTGAVLGAGRRWRSTRRAVRRHLRDRRRRRRRRI